MKIINLKFSLSSLLLSSSIFDQISSERQKLTQKQKLKALKNEFKVLNIQYGMLYDEMLKLNATIDEHLNVHNQNELKSKDVDNSIEIMETRIDDCKLAQANIEAALRSKADLKATNVEFENLKNSMEMMSARIDANKEQQRNFERNTNDRFGELDDLADQLSVSRDRNEELESSILDFAARNENLVSSNEELASSIRGLTSRNENLISSNDDLSATNDILKSHIVLTSGSGWHQVPNASPLVFFKELSEDLFQAALAEYNIILSAGSDNEQEWNNEHFKAHIHQACQNDYNWPSEVISEIPGVANLRNPDEINTINGMEYQRYAICELRF